MTLQLSTPKNKTQTLLPSTAKPVDKSSLGELGKHFKNIWFDQATQRIYLDDLCFAYPNPDYILYTLDSQFSHADYRFITDQPLIMIDIGLHIGSTSILKSRDKNIKRIYAFEPLESTYNLARKNIALNPQYMSKIKTFNFGLADSDRTVKVRYNPAKIGAVSTTIGNQAYGQQYYQQCTATASVQLKEVVKTLTPIFDRHTEKIFMKIDCEGGEHEIFESLHAANMLKRVSIILFEWHFKAPDRLIEICQQNGFICFEKFNQGELGLMHAVKLG